MKYFSILYNSFLWALAASLASFKSEWLEMRVNIGIILFALWPLMFIGISLISRKKTIKMDFGFSAVNLVICTILGLILYSPGRLAVVPAAIVREGLHMTGISFSSINMVLFVFLAVGIIVLFAGRKLN